MVDGINNITSPQIADTGQDRAAALKSIVSVASSQKGAAEAVGREVSKAPAQVRNSGNTRNFLEAAEKLIDASLPDKPAGTKLRIDLDSDSGRFIYQGVDIDTGDVVVQFPSEDVLKLIAFNRERDGVEGLVVDEEV